MKFTLLERDVANSGEVSGNKNNEDLIDGKDSFRKKS